MTLNEAIRSTRKFFEAQGVIEVRTPKLVRSGAMEPYIDTFNVSGEYLTGAWHLATSPEFSMKKIWHSEMKSDADAKGIYEISTVFRDDKPGKNHFSEFTMVEWYCRDTTLAEILTMARDLIGHLGWPLSLTQIDPRPLLAHPVSRYEKMHHTSPVHLNALDLEISSYNLLFDELLLPKIKQQQGLVAVGPYPQCLAALAYCDNGVAERSEIYYDGLEIANAYREEWRPEIARKTWADYNEIRRLRNLPVHALDEELLAALPSMKGVAGIALGLERLIAVLPQ